MKEVASLAILLAALLLCTAHAEHSTVYTEGWSTTQSTPHYTENPSNQSAASNHSVVVNWLLVCEDLCGAGFGGPICGTQCGSSSLHTAENVKYTSVNVCPVLCDFDLGGKKCDCNAKSLKIPKNPKELCDTIYQSFKINIRGCSKCTPNERDTTTFPSTTVTSTMKPTTTTAFTTTTSTTVSDGHGTSTPDWSEVCKELCKKGDGGALCNCDSPPLSRNSN